MITQITDERADVQRALDRRQREHDDGGVDRGDQHARDDDQEREAGPGQPATVRAACWQQRSAAWIRGKSFS